MRYRQDKRLAQAQSLLLALAEDYEDSPGVEHIEDAQGALDAFDEAQRIAKEEEQ